MEGDKIKNKIIISNYQIFLLTIAQAGGASILYLPGVIEAGRNVWLSNILASFVGYLVIYLHYKPLSISNSKSMPMVLNRYWGRFIGGLANLYYLAFFFILSNLILSDVYYFGKITMPETPGHIFLIFLIAPAIYAVKLGIEIISRFLQLLLPLLIILYSLLFAFAIPKLDFSNLLPVAADGIMPIIGGAIPNMNFPYAQILPIVFFYQYTSKAADNGDKFTKYTFAGIFMATLLLSFRGIASISAYEEATLKSLTFPPFNTIRIIEVGDVLERLDAVFIGVFYATTFYKFTITYYAMCKIVSEYFHANDAQTFSVPIAALIGLSMTFFIPTFNMISVAIIPYLVLFIPLLFIMPILLYITVRVHKEDGKS
ncbi:GerAB/ArcD/ProY family transporter [Alkaliphilus serpentinus]|uniref:GerAB/ArcD/ProY family transporter n=1 Tax=Alkaliphilus serpentinus TaxID=1482731 RepID=A0A833M9X5_9FIRM|nr:GerAB/ArcD/ProY family transporter [Alkaliphilus serpentinus]KAB3531091.1 GerAB/ArcD/ProY family transporter [Alkaliphilus serpentinus]